MQGSRSFHRHWGMILVIRNPAAYHKSRTKKQNSFDNKVGIALGHLPWVLEEKHNSVLRADNRDDMRDKLILDGLLGARWNAKHIAHAKKYNLPLDQWTQRSADAIVDKVIEKAIDDGLISFTANEDGFRIELVAKSDDAALEIARLESDFEYDVDERHPLRSTTLPRQVLAGWGLTGAHE